MDSRAIYEIKSDAQKLLVRIEGAVDVADGVVLHRLAEQLQEIAARFRHHKSLETARTIGVGNHCEREER